MRTAIFIAVATFFVLTLVGCSGQPDESAAPVPVTDVSVDVDEAQRAVAPDADHRDGPFGDPTIAWRVLEINASQWTCEIHNRTTARLKQCTVDVHFYDADDQHVGDGILSFRHVRPGERVVDNTICVAGAAARCELELSSVTAVTGEGETIVHAQKYLTIKEAH